MLLLLAMLVQRNGQASLNKRTLLSLHNVKVRWASRLSLELILALCAPEHVESDHHEKNGQFSASNPSTGFVYGIPLRMACFQCTKLIRSL